MVLPRGPTGPDPRIDETPGTIRAVATTTDDMDCTLYREAVSARLDGETTGLASAALDEHLAICPACRVWADAAQRVTRRARVGLADPVPDLTDTIMASLVARVDKKVGKGPVQVASPVGIARFGSVHGGRVATVLGGARATRR